MHIKIGDRVRYIRYDNADDKASGYYPPIGTLGTVVNIEEDGFIVNWDSGTKGDGVWGCSFEDVEPSYNYRVEILIGTSRFSCNCANAESALNALAEIFTEFPRFNKDGVDFEKIINEMEDGDRVFYNECPIYITRLSGKYE